MGTRGYIYFIYKGICYAIYNHFDSYPDGIGIDLLKQIFQLVVNFHGDVSTACEHWGSFFEQLTYGESKNALQNDEEVDSNIESIRHPIHPLNSGVRNLERDLQVKTANVMLFCNGSSQPLLVSEIPDYKALARCSIMIEYVYEIDLDKQHFALLDGRYIHPHDSDFQWKMKQIYQLLLDPSSREENEKLWLRDVGADANKKGELSRYFRFYAGLIAIQACVRRFLAFRRSLQPGSGLNYLLAKKSFERLVQQGEK
eukprot:gene11322-15186_t